MMVDLFPLEMVKVEKALYGIHQAPRAWYETLSTYLLENRFRRGTIDKTLFIKNDKGDILLVQVYVDDIIFRSTNKSLCVEFEQIMHKRFQMSSTGELTFFLGLKVQQKEDGIFISQDKSMIRSLTYLTASRPDIMFAVCAYARFQVTPKVSHLHAKKRIFRYLKGQPKLGLWYHRDSPFDLEAFSDSDYAGASLDSKSTIGVAKSTPEAHYVAATNCCGQVLWIQNQMLDYGFNFMNTKIYIDNESTISIVKNPVLHGKTKHIEIRHHFIRDCYEKRLIQVIKVGDEAIYKELGDRMERAATTASSLEVEQDSVTAAGLFTTVRHDLMLPVQVNTAEEKPNDSAGIEQIIDFLNTISIKYTLTVNPTIYALCIQQFWDTTKVKTMNKIVQIQALVDKKKVIVTEASVRYDLYLDDFEAQKEVGEGFGNPNDPHRTPTDSQPLTSQLVLALETTKTTQALEIASLKIRVKKLKKKVSKRTHKLKRLYKVGVIRKVQSSDDESLGAQKMHPNREGVLKIWIKMPNEKVVNTAEKEVSTADSVTTAGEVVTTATLSITTADIKVSTVVVITSIPNTSTIVTTAKDKGKAIMVELEVPLKMKDQIRLDEELARKLEAEEQEAARLKREEAERQEQANIDLINSSNNVQAMIEADQFLAERLLAREQAELNEEQKASLFMQLLEKRRKLFAAKRAEAKRNKPPTQAQQRKLY
ncbi:putative ribonuclease H-like domain-containing protein [Tanacetum coccineum]